MKVDITTLPRTIALIVGRGTKRVIAMDDLISRAAAIDALGERPYNWTDSEAEIAEVCAWESHKSAIENVPAVDAVPVVRCKDCKYRIVNENYGKRGYMKLIKAVCDLDTGDCFQLGRNAENDDWFCADGERREHGKNSDTKRE